MEPWDRDQGPGARAASRSSCPVPGAAINVEPNFDTRPAGLSLHRPYLFFLTTSRHTKFAEICAFFRAFNSSCTKYILYPISCFYSSGLHIVHCTVQAQKTNAKQY